MNSKNLRFLYLQKKWPVSKIAKYYKCSQNKVNYWLKKYFITKRSISDAIYHMHNPYGDPFKFSKPKTIQEAVLYGLGLGLYWGEGSKRGKGGARLGNTDSKLLLKFIEFLKKIYGIKKRELKFGLQIFNDISRKRALTYWVQTLKVKRDQFYNPIVSKVRGAGTYKYKSEYGVLTVYFNNTRLKELICKTIENIQ